MQQAEQLRAAGVPTFPCWLRYDHNKQKNQKGPRVPEGMHWAHAATVPAHMLDWTGGVFGVPIPAGVLVLDIDTYKGATREAIEQHLGGPLPWDVALVQRTVGGGEHYAFRCDWDARQGDSIDGVSGFDTRVAGKGFICSGTGYTPVGAGLFRLAAPSSLPELPDYARVRLERVEPTAPAPLPPSEIADGDELISALRHIDPGCSRAEWVRVGLALRHEYASDPAAGRDVFDRWSAGEYWVDGCPANYAPEHIDHQWGSFKPEGQTTVATLYYRAIQGGWQPPSRLIDTSGAFGPGATVDSFDALVDRIRAEACDVKAVPALVEAIRAAGCNALQVALAAAELKTALADAGLKDRAVTGHIDGLLHARAPTDPGQYGKSDPGNASLFLSKHYPDGKLERHDGELYAYSGPVWRKLDADEFKHQVAADMAPQGMQGSKINSCIDLVGKLVPVSKGMNSGLRNLIVFSNGVLDLVTGELLPHSPEYRTTVVLPFPYDPTAQCPQWLAFLSDVFEGDAERVALLQEWFGYLLTSDYSHHKVLLLLGPGRSGKGTIGRVLHQLIGDANFSGGSLSSFARDSFVDNLRTCSALFIGDAEKRVPSNKVAQVIERIKSISGHDAVDFDRKYIAGLSTTLPTRITIAANNVPALFDDSGALASRMMVLPFYRSYLGREDLTLADRLAAELAGIAVWALHGLARLHAQGRFTAPAASVEEQDYIRETYSPLTRFVSDCTRPAAGAVVTSVDLYATYRAWALHEGDDVLRQRAFVSAIKDATRAAGVRYGAHRVAGEAVRGFKGLELVGEVPATGTQAAFKVVK